MNPVSWKVKEETDPLLRHPKETLASNWRVLGPPLTLAVPLTPEILGRKPPKIAEVIGILYAARLFCLISVVKLVL